jgi:hypothetical protein
MNPRLSGSLRKLLLGSLCGLLLFSCSKKFPGHREKILKSYIEATQKGDFTTVYKLHRVTARQIKYLGSTTVGNVEQLLKENFEQKKALWKSADVGREAGELYYEKQFFPPSAEVSIVTLKEPPALSDDPTNADYEKANTIYGVVEAVYRNREGAPKFDGRPVKKARFDCVLSKIREGKNVNVYSHDTNWYFGGCISDEKSRFFFEQTQQ